MKPKHCTDDTGSKMTEKEHQEKHKKLHIALDQLFADYIDHHPLRCTFLNLTIGKLITWSSEQCENPTPNREG